MPKGLKSWRTIRAMIGFFAPKSQCYTKNSRRERWQSGRMRRFAKPLYGLTPVPRVRIPPSPPVQQVTAALSLRNWDETMAYKTAIRLFSHERGLLASLVESRTYFWRQVKDQTP